MDNAAARRQMVEQQIRAWDVLDPRVLGALSRVPREAFVPSGYRDLAFADAPIPIGSGQTMLEPKLHGRMLEALAVGGADSVLEIGTGTGYLSACLALLAGQTRSIDIRAEFIAAARSNLAAVPGATVHFEARNAFATEPLGEFDAIAVTGSLPLVEHRFENALKIGGRMFVVIGSAPVMEALLVRRVTTNEWTRESLFETVIDRLDHAPSAAKFVF